MHSVVHSIRLITLSKFLWWGY